MAVHRTPHAADFSLHRLQPGERMIERTLDGLKIAAQFVDHRILLGEALRSIGKLGAVAGGHDLDEGHGSTLGGRVAWWRFLRYGRFVGKFERRQPGCYLAVGHILVGHLFDGPQDGNIAVGEGPTTAAGVVAEERLITRGPGPERAVGYADLGGGLVWLVELGHISGLTNKALRVAFTV